MNRFASSPTQTNWDNDDVACTAYRLSCSTVPPSYEGQCKSRHTSWTFPGPAGIMKAFLGHGKTGLASLAEDRLKTFYEGLVGRASETLDIWFYCLFRTRLSLFMCHSFRQSGVWILCCRCNSHQGCKTRFGYTCILHCHWGNRTSEDGEQQCCRSNLQQTKVDNAAWTTI